MSAFVVNLSGLKGIQDKLNKLDENLKVDLSNEINSSALTINKNAKRNVVVDYGFLRNSIIVTPDAQGSMTYSVEAKTKYAPYVEFGTGGLVKVPVGFEAFAMQFKGKGIKKVNLRARPFLIPAYENEVPKLIDRLNKLIDA
jgi:HK97 gp10 family phage protein